MKQKNYMLPKAPIREYHLSDRTYKGANPIYEISNHLGMPIATKVAKGVPFRKIEE